MEYFSKKTSILSICTIYTQKAAFPYPIKRLRNAAFAQFPNRITQRSADGSRLPLPKHRVWNRGKNGAKLRKKYRYH